MEASLVMKWIVVTYFDLWITSKNCNIIYSNNFTKEMQVQYLSFIDEVQVHLKANIQVNILYCISIYLLVSSF